MKHYCLYIACCFALIAHTQQNTVFLHTFFKDKLLDNSRPAPYIGSSFFPIIESEYDLNYIIRDSSKQYYDFSEILFKKHLVEVKGEHYALSISPIVDFSLGKDLSANASKQLFRNTRGFYIEGDLLKNFSFSTALFENQARFSTYESAYYAALGEMYPTGGNQFVTENAVIPGAARTKPFKTDGFDYAYAVGNIVYKPHQKIVLSAGNTAQFIGDGYRSLLLSDNSIPAPFVKASIRLSKKWQFNYLRMRLMNLIRKPLGSSAETYYNPKAFSVNYITFQPDAKWAISFFEGLVWTKGDSLTTKAVHPLFYNPVPLLASALLNEQTVASTFGLNVSYLLGAKSRLYSQFALGDFNVKKLAFQLGFRGYNYFGLKNMLIQAEYNIVSDKMYTAANSRINYSNGNLPLAAVKGNGFQEIILRGNYERKRMYLELKSILYLLNGYSPLALLPVNKYAAGIDEVLLVNELELGYRFNRKMNLTVFGSYQFRAASNSTPQQTNQVFIGLRTAINNHYNDF